MQISLSTGIMLARHLMLEEHGHRDARHLVLGE